MVFKRNKNLKEISTSLYTKTKNEIKSYVIKNVIFVKII